jgi:hypothetical protein
VTIELLRAGVAPERGHFIVNERFDLSDSPHRFDMAMANSLFRRLPLNRIARCIGSVMAKLAPGGRFYATWIDHPNPSDFEPIAGPDGIVSYPDGEPFHYPFELLATVCESLGYRAERMAHNTHPRGESVMVVTALPRH